MIPKSELKDFLNHKSLQYETPDYLKSDPLGLVHQFTKKEDIEIIALIISTFAWGNRKSIIKYLRKQSKMWEKNCEVIGNKYLKLYIKYNKLKNRKRG